jgi:hypothetical protein
MTYSVWCGGEFIEAFDSGVYVILQRNPWPDPAAIWKRMVAEQGDGTAVGTVQGVPAFESEIDPARPNIHGCIFFVANDVYVVVCGDGTIPLKDLLPVAESVTPLLPPRHHPSPTPSHA